MTVIMKLVTTFAIIFIGTLSLGGHIVDAKEEKVISDDISSSTETVDERVVYIIRHGEKDYTRNTAKGNEAYKYACESEEGWGRAYHMLSVFGETNTKGFITPNALFSYDYYQTDCKTSRGYYRTQSTIAPLGFYLGIDINNVTGSFPELCGYSSDNPDDKCHPPVKGESVHDVGMCCNVAAAKAIKETLFSKQCGTEVKSVLASWEHANISFLAQALGAEEKIEWPNNEFDQVVAIYFDAKTEAYTRMEPKLWQGFKWLGPEKAHFFNREEFGSGEHANID